MQVRFLSGAFVSLWHIICLAVNISAKCNWRTAAGRFCFKVDVFRIEGVKLSEEQKKMPDGSKSEGALNEFIELLKKNKKSLAVIIVTAVVLLGIGILLGSLIGKKSGDKDATQEQSQAAVAQTQSTELSLIHI